MSTGREVGRPAPADSVFPAEYGSPTGPLPPPPPPMPPPPLPDEDLELESEDLELEPEAQPEPEPQADLPVPTASEALPSAVSPLKAKLSPADARSAVSAVGRRLRRGLATNGSTLPDAAPEAPANGLAAAEAVPAEETPANGLAATAAPAPASAEPAAPPAPADPPAPVQPVTAPVPTTNRVEQAESGVSDDGEVGEEVPTGPVGMATVEEELPTIAPPAGPGFFGRRWRDTPIVEQVATASPEDDTVYETLPGRRNRRRQRVRVTRGVHSRRLIRRVDVWTVFKVSLVFYILLLLIVLVAGVAVWNVAQAFGLIHNIEKSIRSLFALTSFSLHPLPVLAYTAMGGAVLTIIGTLLNVVMALLYNLISDIVGGAQVIVVTDPE